MKAKPVFEKIETCLHTSCISSLAEIRYEGAEHCISSDDIFSQKKPPGKTLVVGASSARRGRATFELI